TQPTTAVTSRMPNRPAVFQTVSSTVMRSVSMAPAGGAAYMPSRCAFAAASTPACWDAADCAGGGGGAYCVCGAPGYVLAFCWNAGLLNAKLLMVCGLCSPRDRSTLFSTILARSYERRALRCERAQEITARHRSSR